MAVPILAQSDPQTHSKFALSRCPNKQCWGFRVLPWRSRCLPKTPPNPIQKLPFRRPEISNLGVSGGPEGAWGWSWVLLGSPGGSWRAPGGLPGASRGAPGSLPGGSRASRGGLGGDLGGSGEALGALLGGSRGVLGGSREVLGASWEGSREVLSIPGAPRPPRRPMLDRFGADLGSNLGPGTYENSVFPRVFVDFRR